MYNIENIPKREKKGIEMSTFDKVKEILVEQLECDAGAVTLEASVVQGLDADSLDFVEIGMSIEEEFDIEIDESEYENLSTVGDMVSVIDSKL